MDSLEARFVLSVVEWRQKPVVFLMISFQVEKPFSNGAEGNATSLGGSIEMRVIRRSGKNTNGCTRLKTEARISEDVANILKEVLFKCMGRADGHRLYRWTKSLDWRIASAKLRGVEPRENYCLYVI
ncbi:hypothetical protein MRX96_055320 [Rhipicephalus microplus]